MSIRLAICAVVIAAASISTSMGQDIARSKVLKIDAELSQARYADLIVESISVGSAQMADDLIRVPVTVKVTNIGVQKAKPFKISFHFRKDGREFLVQFKRPYGLQRPGWYAWVNQDLLPKQSKTISGNLFFLKSNFGSVVMISALADSTAGEEFAKDYGRVFESNEDNNKKTSRPILLRPLVLSTGIKMKLAR